jgi:hypothetical protein
MTQTKQEHSNMLKNKVQELLNDYQDKKYVGWHVIAFLDLLGQQSKLRQLNALPNSENQKEIDEFKQKIDEISKPILALRKFFKVCIEASIDLGIGYTELTAQNQEFRRQFRSTPIYHRPFSDSIVLDVPLRNDIGNFPCRAIYIVLISTALTFLSCMSFGWVIRGGIEVGLAMDIDKDEVYGPALAWAYSLESRVANYPRIVVGESLTRYLQDIASLSPSTKEVMLNSSLAVKALNILKVDDDGNTFLDYLAEDVRNVMILPEQTHVVQKAYDFVIQESNRHKEEKNTKLGFRYSLLRNYFESRLPIWGISLQSE